jgi:hypothetical protein
MAPEMPGRTISGTEPPESAKTGIEQDRLAARKIFGESLLRLDQAFITPLDREDILSLINEMDGVVDRVSELSQRFRLY